MHWLLFHFVSGDSLYTGFALILMGVVLPGRRGGRLGAVTRDLLVLFGVLLGFASAAPLSAVWYVLLGIATIAWLVCVHFQSPKLAVARTLATGILLVTAGGGVAWEARHLRFALAPVRQASLIVVGDSISAGITGPDRAWPAVFAKSFGVRVTNLSRVAARASDLLGVLGDARFDHAVVLVEIGGNDLLFGTPPATFEADLRALLKHVSNPTSTVVMFELPVWPTRVEIGRVQRRVAADLGVALIPRRVLAGLLAPADATVDGLHFTEVGAARMADVVHGLVGECLSIERRPSG
jgi:lysophospholipase L1-like esterase